jgi:alkylated DNA repair protein (DNA oxidative demethylase)
VVAVNLAASTIVHRLARAEQLEWIAEIREVCRRSGLVQYWTPTGQRMRVRVSNAGALGWVSDRHGYRYVARSTKGEPWPPIPRRWIALADELAGREPWDAAIVNFYGPGTALGPHVDRSEHDLRRPLITAMFGDSATWAVQDSAGAWHRTQVDTGDVTMLGGPLRSAKHAIDSIVEQPLLSPLVDAEGRPVRGRISVTVRVAGVPAWASREPGDDEPITRDSSGLNWERDEPVERGHHCHAIGCATACPPEHQAADRAIAVVAVADGQWTREQADAWLARGGR